MAQILIIEDMAGVRLAISSMLKKAGHAVVVAETGEQGLEHLGRSKFDLIVTDMLMPGVDGTEVLFQVGKMPGRPPIVAISGGGAGLSAETALKAAKLQADAFLEKPFERAELLEIVERLLSKDN